MPTYKPKHYEDDPYFKWTSSVQIGSRVRLLLMGDDPDPIKPGTEGIVTRVVHGSMAQVGVEWDNGRTLNLTRADMFAILASPYVIQELEP